jgi:hypothetical protein
LWLKGMFLLNLRQYYERLSNIGSFTDILSTIAAVKLCMQYTLFLF